MDQWRSKFSESFSLDWHWSIECSSYPAKMFVFLSGKEKAHKHKQTFPVTARLGGRSPDRVARGLPTGGQRSKVYVLCAEPKEHKHFRPGTRPGGFGYPAGRIGDRGDRENVYVRNVYVPFPAPIPGFRVTCQIFGSPCLRMEDTHPIGGYPDLKVWVCAPFSCLRLCLISLQSFCPAWADIQRERERGRKRWREEGREGERERERQTDRENKTE